MVGTIRQVKTIDSRIEGLEISLYGDKVSGRSIVDSGLKILRRGVETVGTKTIEKKDIGNLCPVSGRKIGGGCRHMSD